MEMADRLYGVTMEEPGVVEADLAEAELNEDSRGPLPPAEAPGACRRRSPVGAGLLVLSSRAARRRGCAMPQAGSRPRAGSREALAHGRPLRRRALRGRRSLRPAVSAYHGSSSTASTGSGGSPSAAAGRLGQGCGGRPRARPRRLGARCTSPCDCGRRGGGSRQQPALTRRLGPRLTFAAPVVLLPCSSSSSPPSGEPCGTDCWTWRHEPAPACWARTSGSWGPRAGRERRAGRPSGAPAESWCRTPCSPGTRTTRSHESCPRAGAPRARRHPYTILAGRRPDLSRVAVRPPGAAAAGAAGGGARRGRRGGAANPPPGVGTVSLRHAAAS